MVTLIKNAQMGKSDLGWLRSSFHFSFAQYFNPDNINFGVLRVLNDDQVQAQTGFNLHPHKNMEIISYVIDGHLTHGDSQGNSKSLSRGEAQYMSAGHGIMHSEHNKSDELTRFLQIWILPNEQELEPNYGDVSFPWEDRVDKWLHLATSTTSPKKHEQTIQIHADINMYVTYMTEDTKQNFTVSKGRQVYLVLIEGNSDINGITLSQRDALTSIEEDLTIHATTDAHLLVIEMEKTDE